MRRLVGFLSAITGLLLVCSLSAQTNEHHRATRLGNPATRFAPPTYTPEQLRALFRDGKLRPDFAAILDQWGWTGDREDLFRAAATAEIAQVGIPVGSTMPFMSSRKAGKPVCLRNVLWAGKEPAPAFAFVFTSKGRLYRCVTPKACSNFYLEDLGPEPKSVLAIECAAPAEVIAGRPVEVCLTISNTGNFSEPRATVRLNLPPGVTVTRTTAGGVSAENQVTWELTDVAPGSPQRVCASLAMRQPGLLSFTATASGAKAPQVQTTCSTRILGVPAILLEVVDVADPVEVGQDVTYDIKVTNQGTAPGTHIRLRCILPALQAFVSGSGTTAVRAEQAAVTMEPLASLPPKASASWRVIVKSSQAGDARFKVELASDQFPQPIVEDESTQQY
jgi:uncharacterized repeat protein (TIGR01451 family)